MYNTTDEKQLKKNIKNLKTTFDYLLHTISEKKSMEYSTLILEKFKKILDIKKVKTICLYDNFNNDILVENIIKYVRENNIKISILNDKMKTPKVIESVQIYKKEKNNLYKNEKSMSIKSAKMIVLSALVFDESSYIIAHKNLYKTLSKNDKALRLGLSYDFQVIPKIELLESSEVIDMIISETRVQSINRLNNN